MYDSIRPLFDSELPDALATVAASPLAEPLARFIYPDEPLAAVTDRLRSLTSIHDFQHTFMKDAIERIISLSITSLTHLSNQTIRQSDNLPALFISNHRDITLDAFLLNYVLANRQIYITFGANLMQDPLICRDCREFPG